MPTLHFFPSQRRLWSRVSAHGWTAHCTGWAFLDNGLYGGEALGRCVVEKLGEGVDSCIVAAGLNGNFALACQGPSSLLLIADPVRSIPLLYRRTDDGLAVSDHIELLWDQGSSWDGDSVAEMATAGIVSGAHTLYREVMGVRSGEFVSLQDGEATPRGRRYYSYTCVYDLDTPLEGLVATFKEVVRRVFDRTVQSCAGRQVLIPLSGGLDSRLVSSAMRASGYENVLCFSYGLPDNREAVKAGEVAKKLEYPWIHLSYTLQDLKEAFSDQALDEYRSFAGNGVSLPHHDDWAALRLLRLRPEVKDDAVVMPGHTGDFICGSHLKYVFDPIWHLDPYDFVTAMIKKHYSLWADLLEEPSLRKAIERRIEDVFSGMPAQSHEDLACRYEFWEWQERQSKFIINAVRSYEFLGFSWRIPLWDKEVMEFWKRVPIGMKMGKYLYRSFLASVDPFAVFKGEAPLSPWSREGVLSKIHTGVKASIKTFVLSLPFFDRSYAVFVRLYKYYKEYRHHPLGLPKLWAPWTYVFRDRSKRNFHSLFLREYLGRNCGIKLNHLKYRKISKAV